MGSQWREAQQRHNLEAADALRGSRKDGFADWEVTVLFYAAMSLVNGWFELRGLGVPTRHHARRRMVEKHLPLLCAINPKFDAQRGGSSEPIRPY